MTFSNPLQPFLSFTAAKSALWWPEADVDSTLEEITQDKHVRHVFILIMWHRRRVQKMHMPNLCCNAMMT